MRIIGMSRYFRGMAGSSAGSAPPGTATELPPPGAPPSLFPRRSRSTGRFSTSDPHTSQLLQTQERSCKRVPKNLKGPKSPTEKVDCPLVPQKGSRGVCTISAVAITAPETGAGFPFRTHRPRRSCKDKLEVKRLHCPLVPSKGSRRVCTVSAVAVDRGTFFTLDPQILQLLPYVGETQSDRRLASACRQYTFANNQGSRNFASKSPLQLTLRR